MRIPFIQLLPALGTLTVFVLAGCGKAAKEQTAEQQYCLGDDFKTKIAWVAAGKDIIVEGIHLTGSVEPNPDKVVNFVSLLNGIVSRTYFSFGDKVSKGQVVAELKSTELSELQAQASLVNEQLTIAQKKLESTQAMYDDGISSQKDLAQAKSEVAMLQAERKKTFANLQLYSASTAGNTFLIKAPSSGIITAKSIAPGTQVTAGSESLFTVSDLSEIWVVVNVYAGNVRHIQEGMEVAITTLSYPDEVFKGKIVAIPQVLDEEAKVLKARVVMQNRDFKLKPGMLVDIVLEKQKSTTAVSVPTSVLVFDDNQHFVVVYKDDCNLERRKVEILSKHNDKAFIREGVTEGEKVISNNQLLIYEQLKNF